MLTMFDLVIHADMAVVVHRKQWKSTRCTSGERDRNALSFVPFPHCPKVNRALCILRLDHRMTHRTNISQL